MTMLENVAKEQKPLIGKSMEDLEAFAQSLGQELFRGRQLFDWIYRKNVYNFSEMSDLPHFIAREIIWDAITSSENGQ